MTNTEQYSVLFIIIVAVLTGISGYVSRIVQKFEDKRDDVKLRTLPLIKHNLMYISKSFELYSGKSDFPEFHNDICNSIKTLDKEISSGNILLTKVNIGRVNQLYWKLKLLNKNLEEIDESDNRKDDLSNVLKMGYDQYKTWLQVNPLEMLKDIQTIISEIDKEIQGYISWSKRIIILVIIIGILIGIVNFISRL